MLKNFVDISFSRILMAPIYERFFLQRKKFLIIKVNFSTVELSDGFSKKIKHQFQKSIGRCRSIQTRYVKVYQVYQVWRLELNLNVISDR